MAVSAAVGVLDVFWLFLMLSSLQPLFKQWMLEASRQNLIARLERERGSRVILLVHRQETMSFLGFPVLRYIDVNDSEAVIRAIHMTSPNIPVDLILHTPLRRNLDKACSALPLARLPTRKPFSSEARNSLVRQTIHSSANL